MSVSIGSVTYNICSIYTRHLFAPLTMFEYCTIHEELFSLILNFFRLGKKFRKDMGSFTWGKQIPKELSEANLTLHRNANISVSLVILKVWDRGKRRGICDSRSPCGFIFL